MKWPRCAYGNCFGALFSRNVISESPATGETSQFLAKQEVLWKGFLNMMTVSKFATKVYLVSGSAETLKLVTFLKMFCFASDPSLCLERH